MQKILLGGLVATAAVGASITLAFSANAGTPASLAASSVPAHAAPAKGGGRVVNPYSPAQGHGYRHGVVPTRSVNAKMAHWARAHSSLAAATGPRTLSYGGGVDGIGVTSGHSKVYLVFYGNQWGTRTVSNGISSFSGDANHAAGAAQRMFKGIGTNNERWSAELTQWCDGPNVASGATSCPANADFVPYQSGGVLSGVWYDNSKSSPSAATAAQLGQEAVGAAAHFGNTTAAANRHSYYVILSPHGTNPDHYQGQYCAWHDWNGDLGVFSPYGDIAFSNQPYNIDSGAGCGVNFLNTGTAGKLDGYTMTLGHEWQETISDQNPAGGWTNHTASSYNGEENSDECAWIQPGQPGGAAMITFSTGSFAEQASWSNDTNNCAISHPIVNHGGTGCPSPGQKLGNPGFETGSAAPWSAPAAVIDNSAAEPAHSGSWKAWLDGYGSTHADTLSQSVTIPSGCSATLSFYLHIDSNETATTSAYDKLTVKLGSTTLATYSNLNKGSGYDRKSFNVSSFAGQTVRLTFTGTEDVSLQTSFVLDDTALSVS